MLRRFVIVGSTAAVFTSALMVSLGSAGGCVHDREPPPPVVDAPKIDVELDSKGATPPVTVLIDSQDKPADLSCLGMERTTPMILDGGVEAGAEDAAVPPGTLQEKEIELIGFGTGGADKLANQTVDIFFNNDPSTPPSATITTDDKGLFKTLLPQGVRVAYRVRASDKLDNYYGLDDLHVPIKLAGREAIRWQGVTLERSDFFKLALTGDKSYRPPPGTGIVAGRVLDCQRRYMQYAEIELRDAVTGEVFKPGKCGAGFCSVFLTDSELPDVGRTYTSRSSLFTLLEVPLNRKLRVVAVGHKEDGSKYDVSWRNVVVHDGIITTQLLEPHNPK